jgi:hypothetical protein
MGQAKRTDKEILKQLVTYADGITAFSALQSVGFVLSVASGTALGGNIQRHIRLTCLGILASVVIYFILLWLCHWNENNLAEKLPKESAPAKAVKTIHVVRYCIVAIAITLSGLVAMSTQLK